METTAVGVTPRAPGSAAGVVLPTRRWIELSDLNWRLIFLLYTAAAVISADTVFTADLAEGRRSSLYYPLLHEVTGYYAGFALLPLLVVVFRRLPIRKDNWYGTVPAHLLISVAFGVTHTLLMYASRTGLYAVLGLGAYDYGQMGYRFLMEYHKQFLHYWTVFAALVGYTHYRRAREKEQQAAALELKTAGLQRQLVQVQLQALRTQLNPHFLFNTLNMISSVMYEDPGRADRMIASLSRMLRLSLEENAGLCVPLRREIEFVNCAVELTRARFGDRVDIDLRCQAEALDLPVPNLLVYTLIENAIKHHDLERESVMRIQARIECDASSLRLLVLDNGPGIRDFTKALSKGLGLKNTRQRLTALYGENHSFEMANRPEGGLQVRITLPVAPKTEPNPL
jgi:hypothetical protein